MQERAPIIDSSAYVEMDKIIKGYRLAFATVATRDLLINKSLELARRVNENEKLPKTVREKASISMESSHTKLSKKLELGQQICRTTRSKDLGNRLDKAFREFQVLLYKTPKLLDELDFNSVSNFDTREYQRNVQESIRRLNVVQKDFHNYVMLAEPKQDLPTARLLSKDVFKDVEEITKLTGDIRLFHCHLTDKMGRAAKGAGTFLIENNYAENEEDVRRLARTLGSAKDSPGILDFVGFRKGSSHQSSSRNAAPPYQLVFFVPNNTKIGGTLERVIQELEIPTLNEHWRCRQDVSYPRKCVDLNGWATRLYQHPHGQWPRAEEEYTMGHDIYSMGVCMLEILLWKPLLAKSNGKTLLPSLLIQRMVKLSNVKFGPANEVFSDDEDEPIEFSEQRKLRHNLSHMDGKDMGKMIMKMVNSDLPSAVGIALTEVVISCLNMSEDHLKRMSFDEGSALRVGMEIMSLIQSRIDDIKI
ncbi:hypothetical protein NHQ30_004106 [Ciborinia camelliae]|nr:hypothetical protein NHQ30_004106 [Ciborinia camelliae]